MLETIGEAFVPVDERRRRAMLVFLAFGTAVLTDDALLLVMTIVGLGNGILAAT